MLQTSLLPEQREINGKAFPLLIESDLTGGDDLDRWIKDHRAELHEKLIDHGAVLLRGFSVQSAEAFEHFLDQTEYKNMPYIGGAAPRNQVTASRIVTANEAPATEKIPFHHEMAQVPVPPGYIFFYCDIASETGGATSLLHSGEICKTFFELNPEFANKVKEQGVCYTRVMPEVTDALSPIGRSWKETFNVHDRPGAEAAMQDAGMSWEWLDDGSVRTTTKVLPAIRYDDETDQDVFFNSLVAVYLGWDDDRNVGKKAVTTADGEPMHEETMQSLIQAMDKLAVNFRWQAGDVLLINNHTTLHARQPYTGDRRILAAIAYK